MSRLILGTRIDRLGVMRRTVPHVRPHVDGIFWMINDRAHKEVAEYAQEQCIPYRTFTHEKNQHSFADSANLGLQHIQEMFAPDWIIGLDSDEDLDHPERLRDAVAFAEANDYQCLGLPRTHWYDLRNHEDKPEWYPDHQWRLVRPNLRFRFRAHSELWPPPRQAHFDDLHIWHYNTAFRTDEDWAVITQEYLDQMADDVRNEGRDVGGFENAPKGVL